jgi:hypothetical protein
MPATSEPISVVVLTGGPVIDRQVARFVSRLEAEPGIDLLAVVSQSPVRGLRGRFTDLWQRRGALAAPILIQNFLITGVGAALNPRAAVRRRRTLRVLGQRIRFMDNIHSDEALQLVRSLKAGLGLVYGGPIVKRKLFSIPRHGTLGIHHGKVPDYRGKKTTFWAVYNGETEVAVMIQKISSKLDRGDVLLQASVPVRRRPLFLIKKLLEDAGIDLYLQAIAAVRDGRASYSPQPAGARILYKDPTAVDILRFWGKYVARLFRGNDAESSR